MLGIRWGVKSQYGCVFKASCLVLCCPSTTSLVPRLLLCTQRGKNVWKNSLGTRLFHHLVKLDIPIHSNILFCSCLLCAIHVLYVIHWYWHLRWTLTGETLLLPGISHDKKVLNFSLNSFPLSIFSYTFTHICYTFNWLGQNVATALKYNISWPRGQGSMVRVLATYRFKPCSGSNKSLPKYHPFCF